MTSSTLAKFEGRLYPPLKLSNSEIGNVSLANNETDYFATTQITSTGNQYLSEDRDTAKIMISMCLTFFTGIFHVKIK